MWVRDRLDALWHDEDFVGWYPRDGRPGISPSRLATICVLQFVLGLSDRQAAEAVHCRIAFKYALAMELDDPGFHHSVLGAFRERLAQDDRTPSSRSGARAPEGGRTRARAHHPAHRLHPRPGRGAGPDPAGTGHRGLRATLEEVAGSVHTPSNRGGFFCSRSVTEVQEQQGRAERSPRFPRLATGDRPSPRGGYRVVRARGPGVSPWVFLHPIGRMGQGSTARSKRWMGNFKHRLVQTDTLRLTRDIRLHRDGIPTAWPRHPRRAGDRWHRSGSRGCGRSHPELGAPITSRTARSPWHRYVA
ncbi:transposase [Streptomyces sp. NPDC008222]|uniref:transposase n=1 Tax=Streptomyces sp. NPDC008222 TaxID=3364820 RepID=UPI0036EF2F9B